MSIKLCAIASKASGMFVANILNRCMNTYNDVSAIVGYDGHGFCRASVKVTV